MKDEINENEPLLVARVTSSAFLIDCIEGMKQYPDNYFDLAIVDPPYGIGEDGAKNHSRGKAANPTKYTAKNWDKQTPSQEYFDASQKRYDNFIAQCRLF